MAHISPLLRVTVNCPLGLSTDELTVLMHRGLDAFVGELVLSVGPQSYGEIAHGTDGSVLTVAIVVLLGLTKQSAIES